ncbi:hypothetical protein [Ancylobacter terrae]|uniref:hypothetical protein n=1 Tax=Ancylobacter sp. sgz301288 TaxID=3342077 RepID=UPI00385D1329
MAHAVRHALRDALIDKVQSGELSPGQAEREAEGLSCGPLAHEPLPGDFNPMGEEFWTLPMAVAWIAYRTPSVVREWWDPYRAECRDWQFRRSRIGFDGPVMDGHFLEQRPSATLARLKLADAIQDRTARDPDYSVPVIEAIEALHVALRTGCFTATGISTDNGTRQEIPDMLWQDLSFGQHFDVDTAEGRGHAAPGPLFTQVTVPSGAITRLWPFRRECLKPSLPPLMAPEGPGYMPLYCAAQWIAAEGGVLDFDPEDAEAWRPAYATLVDAISGGEVSTSGVARGVRETVDGVAFAGCRVSYPFIRPSLELMLSGDFHLRSNPYFDEESWRDGFDDTFENRSEKRWTQLMVRKADIARLWPFGGPATVPDVAAIRASYRSGAAGKPSSMYLVVEEFEARCARGEVEASVGREAEALCAWRIAQHPYSPNLTAKTIKTRIADRFRRYQASR